MLYAASVVIQLVPKTLFSMFHVIVKVDDVTQCLNILVMFNQIVLQQSKLLVQSETLISNWLFFYVESGLLSPVGKLPPHVCKLRPPVLRTSTFIQWGQLIVLLTYRLRETPPGQILCSSYSIIALDVIGSRSFLPISLVHKNRCSNIKF